MRILVAGTGFTGSRILKVLHQAGHDVMGLNRNGILPELPDVQICKGDVLEKHGLTALIDLPPFDLLVSTLSGTGQKLPDRYRSLYVDGPRRIMDALRWKGDPKIWMLGSTGVYGVDDGSWVTEETEAVPSHGNGQVQLEAEQALHTACSDACVFRLSGLYGPGRVRMIRQAMRNRPFLKPEVWANQLHGDDVAGVIRFFVDNPLVLPKLLLVSDKAPARRKEIFSWIREEKKIEHGCLDEDHPSRAGDRGNKRVSSEKLQALGYRFIYPDYRAGLKPLLGSFEG